MAFGSCCESKRKSLFYKFSHENNSNSSKSHSQEYSLYIFTTQPQITVISTPLRGQSSKISCYKAETLCTLAGQRHTVRKHLFDKSSWGIHTSPVHLCQLWTSCSLIKHTHTWMNFEHKKKITDITHISNTVTAAIKAKLTVGNNLLTNRMDMWHHVSVMWSRFIEAKYGQTLSAGYSKRLL